MRSTRAVPGRVRHPATRRHQVADPFHVVGVGTRVIDRVRRRVQNTSLGHRGRKGDPLYRARKLLTMAEERLDEAGHHKLRGLLAAGDPQGEVAAAHAAKECLRELYTLWNQPDLAARWLGALIADLARQPIPELRGMARTLRRWRAQILAWHTTGVSNGPTEGLNALIKLHPLPDPGPPPRRRLQLGTTRHPLPAETRRTA